jgi:hypothetical protein
MLFYGVVYSISKLNISDELSKESKRQITFSYWKRNALLIVQQWYQRINSERVELIVE